MEGKYENKVKNDKVSEKKKERKDVMETRRERRDGGRVQIVNCVSKQTKQR